MMKFIRELRRREVFRTAGLYVGICWILIEVGSVVLPTLNAPEWLLRAIIMSAFGGFPIMLGLAWFFDVDKQGISLQADPGDETAEQYGAHKKDYAIIGLLALALVVSLSLNLKNEPTVMGEIAPTSVLIAPFDNQTDDPLFNGVLEVALDVGIEVAPHITAFSSDELLQIGQQIKPGDQQLTRHATKESARQLAKSQGVKLLLEGTVQRAGNGYRVSAEGIEVADNRTFFQLNEKAGSQNEVLQAIGKLSARIREQLQDPTPADRQAGHAQVFTAASLEAAQAYVSARHLQTAGKLEQAVAHYEQAVAADPNFGLAFANLALAKSLLGRTNEAQEYWAKAQSLTSTMTERERLRTLAGYYAAEENDGEKAGKIYSELVEKYPSDLAARANFASVSFQQADFATAARETREILQILPGASLQQMKLALYAMYQGDWETAASEAGRVVATDPEYGTGYLPIAMASLAQGQVDSSRDAYRRMAMTSKTIHGASVADLGMTDIDLYLGHFDAAQKRLKAGIDADINSGKNRMAALKYIALAQSFAEQQDWPAATTAGAKALLLADDDSVSVSTALIYIEAGDLSSARTIVGTLKDKADNHSRAYAQMLEGMILEKEGAQTEAILQMREAIANADLWLIRYQIGKAYLRAGNFLEAMDELTTLKARSGEATSIYLDHMPTYRSLAELPYWTGRVQEALKNPSAARSSFEEYIALRPQGGALAQDASARIARLD